MNWVKLDNNTVNKTIWKDLDEKDIEKGNNFDQDWRMEFETIFSSNATRGTKTGSKYTCNICYIYIYKYYYNIYKFKNLLKNKYLYFNINFNKTINNK